MRQSLLLVVGVVVVLAGAGFVALELQERPPTSKAVATSSGGLARGGTAVAAPVHEPPPGVKNETDVEGYITELEARARASGRIPKDDVGRGHAAIRALEPQLGRDAVIAKGRQFGERMMRLQRELEIKPVKDELDRLMKELAAKPVAAIRERLVAEYRTTARQLPEAYRAEAMAQLASAVPELQPRVR